MEWFRKVLAGIAVLAVAVLCCAVLPMQAKAETEWYYTYEVFGGEATITDVDTYISGDITIPSTLGGYPVTSIGTSAFSGCSSLTSVTIPDSVTSIGSSAFRGCSSLESVNIPDGVTSIGYSAFDSCSSLESVTIPDGVKSIGNSAFRDCSSLKSINIPDGVTSIGTYAFYGCSSLESAIIGEGVTWIGWNTFENCSSLTSIHIPDSVTSIDDAAFAYCSSLASINIPAGVTDISASAFWGCSSLTGIWVDADNNAYYSDQSGVLYTKDMTTLLQAPGALAGEYAIPEGVTSIGWSAFEGCSSLTSIYIPDGVTSIENYVFRNCTSLASVNIPNGVTSIKFCVFSLCSSLESINIPDSVTYIDDKAFYGCSSLTSITIPDGVKSIGASAFYGCSSLESIAIPDSVESIGGSAFYGCSSLTSITIPDGVKSIGGSAFRDCSSLESVNIPDGVKSIGGYAFSRCSSLTSITIPDSVTSIGGWAFDGCSSLESVTIPDSVTSIDWHAFSGCSSLVSITIPDGVTSIGNSAFAWCSSLTSVTIGEGVTSIGGWAFDGCSSLTSITIPDSVESIGYYAFDDCSSLETVYYAGSEEQAGQIAIDNYNDPLTNATWVYNYTPEVEPVEVEATLTGLTGSLEVGQTATITVNVSEIPRAEFAMVRVQLPKGLRLVSGSWLVEGVIADFDMVNGYAVFGLEEIRALGGDVFQFVVEGRAAGTDLAVEVSFEAKIDDILVAAAETTEQVDVESGLITPQMTLNGLPERLEVGQTATITVNVSEIPYAEFAMVRIELPAGLKLVSGWWMIDGAISSFDTTTGYGVFGLEEIRALGGDFFRFVVEGRAVGENQTIQVSFEAKVDDTLVATATAEETMEVVEKPSAISLKGLPERFYLGQTATITVNVQGAPDAEFAMAHLTLGDGLELVSARWLKGGSIADFDTAAGYGVWAPGYIVPMDGDLLQLVVKATAAGNQQISVDLTFKIDGTIVGSFEKQSSVEVLQQQQQMLTFLYEDGSVFAQLEAGSSMPEGPAKAADNTYTYAFAGWVQEGETTYRASYTATYIEYKVVFQNDDGSVISERIYHWNDAIVVPSNPKKAADNTYTYTFSGWDGEIATICQGSATYTANYLSAFIDYTVTFFDYDGQVISQQTYHYGDPIVVPENPTRDADNVYAYTFVGWHTEVGATCGGDADYYAIYSATYRVYEVTFLDYNGDFIGGGAYFWGDPIVIPENPTRAADNTYTYTFAGWDREVSETCQADATYIATYEATFIVYTVTFHFGDDTVTATYHYGDVVEVPEVTADRGYVFVGWDKQVVDCNGDAVYTAVFEQAFVVGDMDGKPGVSGHDAIYLLYHIFKPETYPVNQPCDFNGDGEVNGADAVYLLYYTFLPEEYPLH